MTSLRNRRQFLFASLSAFGMCSITGCGTILHPERRGQGRASGEIDWRVAGLDAAGLLLFFVPGVVAFAVDFHQGTIFLPSGTIAGPGQPQKKLVARHFPEHTLNRRLVEDIVSAHTQERIALTPGFYRSIPLPDLSSFWSARDQLMKA